MTRDEVNTAAWMVAINQVDGRSFPEMRGAMPELRQAINRILGKVSSGLGSLGDGLFDAIGSAITAATDMYTAGVTARGNTAIANIQLQMTQAQAAAAQQVAAAQQGIANLDTTKTIAMVVGGLGAAGLLAWWFFGRRSRR